MKSTPLIILTIAITAFIAGYAANTPNSTTSPAGKKILHYIDPMHPSYTSDKPGIAPDCGMQLEPVYADGSIGGSAVDLIPGTVEIDGTKQQLIGIRLATVDKSPPLKTLRLTGRVVPDERRIYVINATIDGWITSVGLNTTGSIVRKDETLASFYSPDFLSATQALIFALKSADQVRDSAGENEARQDQLTQFSINLRQYSDSLRNLGMGQKQIDKIIKTRKYVENVDITSPAGGIVLARSISPGQRFERGKELYRIADLSKVWVVADAFEDEASWFRPSMAVPVRFSHLGKILTARVSTVPPQFDSASRTMKVRLELDNPGYLLRPDMFADVELQVRLPEMISVPVDAVIDSGARKTVYVQTGPSRFEPREVITGRRFGDRIELLTGVSPSEKVVASGTFLMDSESRMKAAAAGIVSRPQRDPVCGMYVDEDKARAAGRIITVGTTTHFFCSSDCRSRQEKLSPLPIGGRPGGGTSAAGSSVSAAPDKTSAQTATDPICGMTVKMNQARQKGKIAVIAGTTHYFCSPICREEMKKRAGSTPNGNGSTRQSAP